MLLDTAIRRTTKGTQHHNFLLRLGKSLDTYGSLTPAMLEAVARAITESCASRDRGVDRDMTDTAEIIPAEVTAPQQRIIGPPFLPGVSGNPAGRAKGARSKHGENFLRAFNEDFQRHGAEVIAKVRIETPAIYLKIAADLLPKEMALMVGSPGDFAAMQTAEEIVEQVRIEMGDRAADLLVQLIEGEGDLIG